MDIWQGETERDGGEGDKERERRRETGERGIERGKEGERKTMGRKGGGI